MTKQETHNKFVDKREQHKVEIKSMSEHELVKMKFNQLMGKIPKERSVKKNKNIYNLEDDEITFKSDSLGVSSAPVIDDAADTPSAPLAVGDFDPNKPKTNRERYAEIIAKSKFHKYQRQKELEERHTATEALDDQFQDLKEELLADRRRTADEEESQLPPPPPLLSNQPVISKNNNENNDAHSDYLKLFRTFEMDARAPASDRTKTTEELMKEESERLHKLEEARLKRMRGEDMEDGPDGKRPKHTTGDELTDDYGVNPAAIDADDDQDLDEEALRDLEDMDDLENMSDDALEEEEQAILRELKAAGHNPDADDGDFDGGDEEAEGEEEGEGVDDDDDDDGEGAQLEEIPYQIEVPSTYESFAKLIKRRGIDDRMTIVERIIVCNHITLNRALNKPKMRAFFPILWRHYTNIVKFSKEDGTTWKQKMKEVDHLAKHIWQLSQEVPEAVYSVMKESLPKIYKDFNEKLENREDDELLSVSTLMILKMVGNIFPTSDQRNVVVTPCTIIIGQAISQAPIDRLSRLLRSLFLCNLSLSWVGESRRYAPEAVTLLVALIERLCPIKSQKKTQMIIPSLVALDEKFLTFEKSTVKLTPKPLDMSLLQDDEAPITDQIRVDLLQFCVNLLKRFFDLYATTQCYFYDCVPQIFEPAYKALSSLSTSTTLSSSLIETIKKLIDHMKEKFKVIVKERAPLQFQNTGPQTIDTLDPNFDPNYNGKKRKTSEEDIGTQRHKLKLKVKKELHAAARELKNDAMFIQRERMKKQQQITKKRKEDMGRITSMLEKEAHEKKLDKIRKNPIKFF
eukprot:TRINITY_DN2074_c0_g1_i1.p1 TRINITY_DN2074_c0_g1~~TRINITY_DN2074_c0_g1_i1.p1  ORF type:complete len:800 (+),score=286.95 TRINITY_DN2074_c0_g1_i1:329-2728(+)